MIWFHVRQLARTSFFIEIAVTAPISFLLLRVIGSMGAGVAVPPTLWFDGAVAGIWATTTTAAGIIGFQRFQGTLQHIVFTVWSPAMVFGALTTAAAMLGIVGLPVSLTLAAALVGVPSVTLGAVMGFVAAVSACSASAALLSSLFVVTRRAIAFEPILLTPVWLLVGLVVPLGGLPAWLQPVALLHPLTSAVAAARSPEVSAAAGWMLLSVAIAAVWFVVARYVMGLAVRRAVVDGTLALA